jgi:uncharacterized membrane protein YphA (DoxX/SURF4 family)
MRLPGSVLQGILASAALVFLRIFLGLVFLLSAWAKLESHRPPLLRALLAGVPGKNGYHFYQEFLRQALPNLDVLAGVLAWCGLLVGIALIVGLLTRLSAVLALVLAVHSHLASGSLQEAAYGAIAISLVIGAAGRTFGLDKPLARRWPRSPLW